MCNFFKPGTDVVYLSAVDNYGTADPARIHETLTIEGLSAKFLA